MNFHNNPFDLLLEVVKKEYSDVEVDIYFGANEVDGEKTFGVTIFPSEDNNLERPVIEVFYGMSLPGAVEILAHEIAHVIAGFDADHGEEWESIFDNLYLKFNTLAQERFKEGPL